MVLTLLGAGLLWFGWFGFNGGSALGSGALAGMALTATQIGAAGAGLSWMFFEWLHRGKPTALGLASGVVAGLVAVTPAAGYVVPLGALFIGLIAGLVCYAAVVLKPKLGYDDSLDAFGIHGVGGFLGALLTGLLANDIAWQQANGYKAPVPLGNLTEHGVAAQFGAQFVAALAAAGYAFVVTLVLVKVLDLTWGFTTDAKEENEGLDRTQHGEVGFDLGPALQEIPAPAAEPRPATVPPDGRRHFSVVVEGAAPQELMHVWSQLCQAGATPPPEFRNVYAHMTTVQGNRFRFRGGDPNAVRDALQRLFQERLSSASLSTRVE
jgi:Amt family ammonium transporter